ncbi:MAG TPA: DUF1800 domain-containing protein [Acidimicrobiales bacterium]
MTSERAVVQLLRRAGFGATASEVEEATAAGYPATVDRIIADLSAPDAGADAVAAPQLGSALEYERRLRDARRAGDTATARDIERQLAVERRALIGGWLARMVASTRPVREKLTFLLHGHFPTALSKVRYPDLMARQIDLLRAQGAGSFADLTQAVATDPAMLLWLDAASDVAADPNENFARELMERFTMGIGTYREADVRAAAYCFTGWRIDLAQGGFVFDPALHSSVTQQVLGAPVSTGQEVVALVASTPASHRFVPAALWSHLAYPVAPSDHVVDALSAAYAPSLSMTDLLRAVFEHPAFVSTTAATGLVKQPVEWLVGALRSFGVTADQVTSHQDFLLETLAGMGQIPCNPPSVGGWAQNEYWLSTSAALARWTCAHALASVVDLAAVADASASARIETLGSVLGVPTWSPTTASVLRQAGGDPALLTTLAFVSPDYVTN